MKIYVVVMEVLRKKEKQDEIQLITKIDGFLSFTPAPLNANVFFCRLFKSHLMHDKIQGSSYLFPLLYG
jgi:hypothetical protein